MVRTTPLLPTIDWPTALPSFFHQAASFYLCLAGGCGWCEAPGHGAEEDLEQHATAAAHRLAHGTAQLAHEVRRVHAALLLLPYQLQHLGGAGGVSARVSQPQQPQYIRRS